MFVNLFIECLFRGMLLGFECEFNYRLKTFDGRNILYPQLNNVDAANKLRNKRKNVFVCQQPATTTWDSFNITNGILK